MKKLTLTAVLLTLPGLAAGGHEPPAPADLVSVPEAGVFWPYTGRDYSGTPTDPINLVFVGDADPRLIRQALLALDGDRTASGFPKWCTRCGRTTRAATRPGSSRPARSRWSPSTP